MLANALMEELKVSFDAVVCLNDIDVLQACSSMIASASDLWTSQSSVFSYCGSVIWYINDDWALCKHVLDLSPLDGDHSGAALGKILFVAFQW